MSTDFVAYFFDFVVPGVLLVGVGVLGLAGNVLSAVVLSRPQMSRLDTQTYTGCRNHTRCRSMYKYTGLQI